MKMGHNIDSVETRGAVHRRLGELLRQPDRASLVGFVDSLEAEPDWQWALDEVRGVGLIDGGSVLGARDLIEQGVKSLHKIPHPGPRTEYNIANGENSLWEVTVRAEGIETAMLTTRHRLHASRRAYERLGRDESVDADLRVQCLVNAGNSYDTLGRDQDALALWDEALAVDPDFAMAHGNRGLALLYAAPFAGAHGAMLAMEAAWELDLALAQPEAIARTGDVRALEHFQQARSCLPADPEPLPAHDRAWRDPHLDWCREHELFLHTSHRCLTENEPLLDPLFFASISGPVGDAAQQRADDLTDSINALKQEFISVRYLTWLALEHNSPIAPQASAVKARARFLDSLNYARWGVRTGLAVQAFVSTTNLLDKVAVVAHAYFRSSRNPKKTSFRSFWRSKKGKVERMDPVFVAAFALGWNSGLAALFDLSNDLEDDTPLSRLVAMRHAATHRLLIAHDGTVPPGADWLTRVEFDELAARSLEQLRLARGAVIYLLRAIDAHERYLDRDRGDGVMVPMPTFDVDPELTELD